MKILIRRYPAEWRTPDYQWYVKYPVFNQEYFKYDLYECKTWSQAMKYAKVKIKQLQSTGEE